MDKKSLQRQRMMQYFIDAAKQIIRNEGIREVTVRKVADIAGYSYATIYNYFDDLNTLLWYTVPDYLDEVNNLINQSYIPDSSSIQIIKSGYIAFTKYFLQNPNIYRFLYLTELTEPPDEVAAKIARPALSENRDKVLNRCAEEGFIDKKDVPVIGDLLTATVHGLIFLYFTGKMDVSEQELLDKITTGIEYILQRKPCSDADAQA